MFTNVIYEFQNITRYPIYDFLERYKNFMEEGYPAIRRYFNGEVDSIDNLYMNQLSRLTNDCRDILILFNSFANKLQNCCYWELLDYIQQLNDDIEKINKLPKFLRTSLAARGYTPTIQVASSVGSMRTVDDVANLVANLNSDNTSWVQIMLNNDLNEDDWEIDALSKINVYVSKNKVVVNTILDQPIGNRVYGKDILRKISYTDNDLSLVEYEENIEQKCNILCALIAGDVPENMMFGISSFFAGSDMKQYSYPEIVRQVMNNFLQNDLFDTIDVSSIDADEGSIIIKLDIKTKYDYKTQNTVVI